MILLAQLLVDVFYVVDFTIGSVDADQLDVDFSAVIDIKGSLDDILQLLFAAKLTLQVHEGNPQVQFIVFSGHGHLLNSTLSYASRSLSVQVLQHEGHVLDPEVRLIVVSDEEPLKIVDALRNSAIRVAH